MADETKIDEISPEVAEETTEGSTATEEVAPTEEKEGVVKEPVEETTEDTPTVADSAPEKFSEEEAEYEPTPEEVQEAKEVVKEILADKKSGHLYCCHRVTADHNHCLYRNF